jgi:anti-sigma B factor antagonist
MDQPIARGSAKLTIEVIPVVAGVLELKLTGEIGMASANSLNQVIKQAFDQSVFRMIVNLSGVYYIASTGMGILISSASIAKEKGGEFIFAGASDRVKHVFDLMGLLKVLRFTTNSDEALKIFKKGAA